MFAYLQSKHFKMILDTNLLIKNLIIGSDGCGHQNRNSTVSNMYLDLSMRSGVTIQQTYLITGPTQMECDSMHSTIERKLCCDIYTPCNYVMLFIVHVNNHLHITWYRSHLMKYSGYLEAI